MAMQPDSVPVEADIVVTGPAAPSPRGTGVTVSVSSYNYAAFIVDCLDSVFAQTHDNIELIVVDDCSTDRSLALLKSWLESNATRFNGSKLIAHRHNYGLFQARNTGFEAASNDFVFVLDSDNMLYASAIAKLLSGCLHSGAEAAYSQLELFGEREDIAGAQVWDPERLARGNYIDAMAMVRKSAWQAVGGYSRLGNPGLEDYDMWCNFVERGFKGVFVPEILCRYRVHGQSMLQSMVGEGLDDAYFELMVRHPWLKL